jgi:hypothetical protein
MTETQVKTQEVVIETSNIIYRAYIPFNRQSFSELHTDNNGRQYRIAYGAIIVDRRSVQEQMGWSDDEASDHFTTFFEVDGLLTDVRKTNFDFRHNGLSTGAEGLKSYVVDDYPIEIDNKVLKVKARMLEVKVYTDSMLRIIDNSGKTVEDGNLLEALENGRIKTWSIEFRPVSQGTTRSGVTIYRTYHTPRISFLDVTQGIPDASIDGLRAFNVEKINNMSITLENIKTALESGELNKDELRSLIEPAEKLGREINIEKGQEPSSEETPPDTNEADTNNDGDISDEEMRSYITKLKRAYSDPDEVKNKIDELERMFGEMKAKVDSKESEETQRKIDEEEKDAQRIRALNDNLKNAPEKVKSEVSEKQSQLDTVTNAGATKGEFTVDEYRAIQTAIKLQQLNQ